MFLENVSDVTTMPEALMNTGIGMGTVFLVLILISFIIYLLKFVPMLLSGKKKEEKKAVQDAPAAPVEKTVKKEEAPADVPAAAPADDAQLVAVIAAAIAASMEEETGVPVAPDGLVIRSIKKRTFSL